MTDRNETPKRIEVEVEVPGTPEEVWDAIATGPGITAWFAPAEVEGREGGKVGFDMGSGTIEMSGALTAWDPPRRFVYEEEWQPDESAPAGTLAHEWLVEARAGGTCIVRVVASAFGSADWSDELDQMREGWTAFLHNLRTYLTNFAGETCTPISINGGALGSIAEVWTRFRDALGIDSGAAEGDAVRTAAGVPPLTGTVDQVIDGKWHAGVLVRTTEPAPGFGMLFVYGWQGQTHPIVSLYLFGDDAPAAAERNKTTWKAWMEAHFPAPAEANAGT